MGLKGHSAPGTLFLCTNKASVAAAHVRSWRMQRWTPTTRCGRGTSVQWLEASRSRDRPTSPRHTSAAAAAAAAAEVDPLKIATAPTDFRFPYTNQIRHCYARHLEYHQCRKAGGDEALECDKFQRYYRSLCPTEWVVAWNEQRKFPGPL